MGNTYQRQADTAQKLIAKNGQPVTFYTPSTGGGEDPATGEPIAGTPRIEAVGDGLLLSYKNSDVDGTTVQRGDAYVLYFGQEPTVGMYYDDSFGKTWQVQNVDPLRPTSVNILYKVQVR